MAIYHCSIKIISRSGGRSAVASAAYRSGEKLYNDETGLLHDFTHKGGVVMNEIILPENAPERYHNRQILWNEVQKIEKRSDAQFAREVEVALPMEMDREDQIRCIRDFIKENFVSEGMIADWALHDKGDGNPHAHILLTMRSFDEHEKWLQKQRSVFANARDEKGRAVYDPSLPVYDPKNREETSDFRIPQLDKDGKQKVRIRKGKGTEYLWEKISIPANDWNDRSKAEIWRASWAKHCNRYLDKDHQIDHRSYERQGIDKEPTIHEGVTARQMEVDGKLSDRCQQNREIRERNSLMEEMKAVAQELTKIITEKAREIFGRFKKFRRDFGDFKSTGRDAGYLGSPTGRDRDAAIREAESSGTIGRIHELKRTVDRTASEIDKTDYEIAVTDQRITELREIAQRKEAIRNERLERLKRRRNDYHVGGDAGSDRGPGIPASESPGRQLKSTRGDIEAFLGELSASERASAEKRDNRIAERKDRDASKERSSIRRKLALAEEQLRAERAEQPYKERSRSRGRSR